MLRNVRLVRMTGWVLKASWLTCDCCPPAGRLFVTQQLTGVDLKLTTPMCYLLLCFPGVTGY